ncbi:MAG: DUF1599 domain-containing protein [Marinifilaceae bacterium]
MIDTSQQYDQVIDFCTDIFVKKMHDYGTAWRILRPTSLTDQIFIKANRIRSIEEKGTTKVGEGIIPEFVGIINYSIMGIIQLHLGCTPKADEDNAMIERLYKEFFQKAKELMMAKNHDYDEAWRHMRISSYTDLILMKIKRTKQIEDNGGATLISEGIDANYYDMINYSVFALIRLIVEKENYIN